MQFARLPSVRGWPVPTRCPRCPRAAPNHRAGRANLRRAREVIGIPKHYADYREMLAEERFDIVIFCPENARHGEVAEAIAAAGAHMVTEKPMAASLADALRMARACAGSGVELMVNWPTTWSPAIRTMKELLDQGVIGEVLRGQVAQRRLDGATGLRPGADAFSDAEKGAEWWHQCGRRRRGAAGLLLLRRLPLALVHRGTRRWPPRESSANLTSPYGDAEDNAMMTVRFPRALAILEGTWTTWNTGVPTGPIVYGRQGALVVSSSAQPSGTCSDASGGGLHHAATSACRPTTWWRGALAHRPGHARAKSSSITWRRATACTPRWRAAQPGGDGHPRCRGPLGCQWQGGAGG